MFLDTPHDADQGRADRLPAWQKALGLFILVYVVGISVYWLLPEGAPPEQPAETPGVPNSPPAPAPWPPPPTPPDTFTPPPPVVAAPPPPAPRTPPVPSPRAPQPATPVWPREAPEKAPAPVSGPVVLVTQAVLTHPPVAGTKGGFPYRLLDRPPPSVRRAPPEAGLLYGILPFQADPPLVFAMRPPAKAGDAARFYLDRNRNGDFLDDDPPSYEGSGTFRTAFRPEFELPKPDGGSLRYSIWLWTSVDHPAKAAEPGFVFYSQCVRLAHLIFTANGRTCSLPVVVADEDNSGTYRSDRVFVDWNGNGRPETVDWLKVGVTVRYGDAAIRLDEIGPFGERLRFTLNPPAVPEGAADILAELPKQAIDGNLAPPLEGLALDGAKVSLERLRGQVVLVDFWATWCGPCRKEMPNLKEAHARFREAGLQMIGVSLDKDFAALREFLREEGIAWPQLCDGGGWESEYAKRYHVKGIPESFLLDREGRIVVRGASGEFLLKRIKETLEKR